MSRFLYYFDEGAGPCESRHAVLTLRDLPIVVRYEGCVLTERVVAISDGTDAMPLYSVHEPTKTKMGQALALFVAVRLLAGFSPRMFWHDALDDDFDIHFEKNIHLDWIDLHVGISHLVKIEAATVHATSAVRGQALVGKLSARTPAEHSGFPFAEGSVGTLHEMLLAAPEGTLVSMGKSLRAVLTPQPVPREHRSIRSTRRTGKR